MGTPNFPKMVSKKHHLVKEDCNKFAPTKAVNHNQFIFTKTARARLIRTKLPAMPWIRLFLIVFIFMQLSFPVFSKGPFDGDHNGAYRVVSALFPVEFLQQLEQFPKFFLLGEGKEHDRGRSPWFRREPTAHKKISLFPISGNIRSTKAFHTCLFKDLQQRILVLSHRGHHDHFHLICNFCVRSYNIAGAR